MDKINQAADLGGAPIFKNDLRIQFNKEFWDCIEGLMSSFNADTEGVVLTGCVVTANSGNFDMTSGIVYLNGEFMRVLAATNQSFTKYLAPKTPANDVRTFADGTSHIVMITHDAEMVSSAPGSGQYLTISSLTDLDDRRWSNILVKGSRAQIPWTNITLINSWTAASGQTPQYMVDGFGQVHFRGALNGTGLTNDVFAVIPAGIAHTVDRDVATFRFNGSAFEVKGFEATATGNWRSFSTTLNNTFFLDGVSYWP